MIHYFCHRLLENVLLPVELKQKTPCACECILSPLQAVKNDGQTALHEVPPTTRLIACAASCLSLIGNVLHWRPAPLDTPLCIGHPCALMRDYLTAVL